MATTATPKETSAKARKPPERSVNAPATTPLVLAAFAAVYLLWGSTYLAIRVGVETVPPLILAGLRHFTVGVFLYPILRWKRSEEHTSELQSRLHLVCRLLLEKKK